MITDTAQIDDQVAALVAAIADAQGVATFSSEAVAELLRYSTRPTPQNVQASLQRLAHVQIIEPLAVEPGKRMMGATVAAWRVIVG